MRCSVRKNLDDSGDAVMTGNVWERCLVAAQQGRQQVCARIQTVGLMGRIYTSAGHLRNHFGCTCHKCPRFWLCTPAMQADDSVLQARDIAIHMCGKVRHAC
jgi:hypothetical protein